VGWVDVLASLGGVSFIGMIVNAFVQRRKIKAESGKIGADAAAVLTESATKFADEVREAAREDTAVLRRELQDTRSEIAALRRHLAVVEGMLRRYLPPDVAVPDFVWPLPNGR
jgi:hypothetical protein